MQLKFASKTETPWELHNNRVVYGGKTISLTEVENVIAVSKPSFWGDGIIRITTFSGVTYRLAIPNSQKNNFDTALEYLQNNYNIEEKMKRAEEARIREEAMQEEARIKEDALLKEDEKNRQEKMAREGIVYSIDGVRGRHLDVYEDKVVISTKVTVGSIITGNATDGAKTIYYADCIGVQFRKTGAFIIGYLQFETASGLMNNRSNNFFNENSFTFDESVVSDGKMEEVARYVQTRIDQIKKRSNSPVGVQSAADEIKKFKELLDLGIISQEEFDAKKKQLLGL